MAGDNREIIDSFQIGDGMSKETEFKRIMTEKGLNPKEYDIESSGVDGYDDGVFETFNIVKKAPKVKTKDNKNAQKTTKKKSGTTKKSIPKTTQQKSVKQKVEKERSTQPKIVQKKTTTKKRTTQQKKAQSQIKEPAKKENSEKLNIEEKYNKLLLRRHKVARLVKEKENALKKCEEQLNKIDKRKDPKLYNEGEIELQARKDELKEARKKLGVARGQLTRFVNKYQIQNRQHKYAVTNKRKIPIEDTKKQEPLKESNSNSNVEKKKEEIKTEIDEKLEKLKMEKEKAENEYLKFRKNMDRNDPEDIEKLNRLNEKQKIARKKLLNYQNREGKAENTHSQVRQSTNGQNHAKKIEDQNSKVKRIEDKQSKTLKLVDKQRNPEPIANEKNEKGIDAHPIVHPDVSIEKTGLQIFREQFNNMPELKGRHALSENPFLKLPVALAPGVAGIAATGVGLIPVLGVTLGTGALYAVSKPIIKKITGQSKVEKQISKQFEELYENNPEEFDKMAKYLTEEVTISLKPHCAILNSLNKVAKAKYTEENKRLWKERNEKVARRKELSAKKVLTKAEEKELADITRDCKEKEKKIEENQKAVKEIKRGTQRKSASYKGNMQGRSWLNLFAKRNHSSKDYSGPLNEYADAEKSRDMEIAYAKYNEEIGETDSALEHNANSARFEQNMQDIMEGNTYSKLGVHRSVFNGGKGGTTVKVVSDVKDKTIETVGSLFTVAVGIGRVVHNLNDAQKAVTQNADEAQRISDIHNQSVDNNQAEIDSLKDGTDISDSDLYSANASEYATQVNAQEMSNVNTYGTVSSLNQDYVNADATVNATADRNLSGLNTNKGNELSDADRIREIAQNIRNSGNSMNDTYNAMQGMTVHSGVDHSAQETLMGLSENGKEVEASIMEKYADVLDQIDSMTAGQKLNPNLASWIKDNCGPALIAYSTIATTLAQHKENRKEKKWKRSQEKAQKMKKDVSNNVQNVDTQEVDNNVR